MEMDAAALIDQVALVLLLSVRRGPRVGLMGAEPDAELMGHGTGGS